MRRRLIIWVTLLARMIAVAAPAYLVTASPTSLEQENEPIVHRGSTACGVGRSTLPICRLHDDFVCTS
jgi:hypothetical protein